MSGEHLKRLHEQVGEWYARGYLSTWCDSVRPEWAEFLDRVFPAVAEELAGPADGDPVVVDVGCGPSIAGVISASRWSSRVYLADYLKCNRDEVERFWSGAADAFRWEHYFKSVVLLLFAFNSRI